jgi:hypothetical protein
MYAIVRRGNERNARQVLIDSGIIAQYRSPGDVFRSKLHFHPCAQGPHFGLPRVDKPFQLLSLTTSCTKVTAKSNLTNTPPKSPT